MSVKGPDLTGLQFSLYTAEEIRKLSVVEIITPLGINMLGYPLRDGLYDLRMGPSSDHSDPCGSCKQTHRNCPGHFGRIELPLPVVSPLFHKPLFNILKMSCLRCFKVLLPEKAKIDIITMPDQHDVVAESLKQQIKAKNCVFCKNALVPVQTFENRLMVLEIADKYRDEGAKRVKTAMLPKESKEILRQIFDNEKELLTALFPVLNHQGIKYPTDLFFIECLLVPPPKVRPLNYLNGKVVESSQARIYRSVLNDCITIRNISKLIEGEELSVEAKAVINSVHGTTPYEKLNHAWSELQKNVDFLLDSDRSAGLKQIIEKKEGLVRMHMMGKRVNFAARSVITPDPNLNIEEIGIPEYFAKRLSYPVLVNPINVDELRKMVLNGPDVYPGATLVEDEDGSIKRLFGGGGASKKKRAAIAKTLLKSLKGDKLGGTIVHRHLLNGDPLLLNRQPTLHRPSIMAHKARILPGEKTLRMHYSNCKSYNADFDGDEMNLHCPQNELARSEAAHIVKVSNQYLVPKDGTPLGGLIQDHVVSGVHLTVRGRFFNKQDYQQLVYQGLGSMKRHIKLVPPCIVKPQCLWSGKQVISTVLLNITPEGKEPITLTASAKVNAKSWQKLPPRKWACGTEFTDEKEMSEAVVLIQRGHLLSGVLDKQHYGATQFGLTHCLFELYGGDVSTQLLNALGKIFTYHLQLIGFTIGVEDILVKKKMDKKRKEVINKARSIGDQTAARALELDEVPDDLKAQLEKAYYSNRTAFRAKLDNEFKKALDGFTNEINKICLPGGLVQKFPHNNLQLMVTSGAKGSTVNTMQISCLLGQIELEGKRPPLMISGRSLPSFVPFETAPKAGGYVDGRFMTGINPQDFFFHCMAGREGLIDTAVKTSRSGYLQRCLIKHLEGLTVGYDHTVRNHDGSVIQFLYGEDGLEVTKATFLKKNQMDFLYRNRHAILDKYILQQIVDGEAAVEVDRQKHLIKNWLNSGESTRLSGFSSFSKKFNKPKYAKIDDYSGRPKSYFKALKKWKKMDEDSQKQFFTGKCPDPVSANFYPQRTFGVISENLESIVEDYLSSRNASSKMSKTTRNLINLKSMMSLCEPGEPVGLLAAQSIGEPSTQMTLNTFHFAGRGDMNVTLGIPRLREILMTASKHIKTPSMDIPLISGLKKIDKKAEKMCRTFQRVNVADVLERVTVKEKLLISPSRVFTYTVRFEFLPFNCYKKEFVVTPKIILRHMERGFLVALSKAIRALGKKLGDVIHVSQEEKEVMKTQEEDEGNPDEVDAAGTRKEKNLGEEHVSSDEEAEGEDDDATTVKLRGKHEEAFEYDGDSDVESEEEEKEVEEGVPEEKEDEEEKFTNEELKIAGDREATVLKTFNIVQSYKYDINKEEWCEIIIGVPVTLSKIDFSSLLREIAEKSVIYEVPNIRRAIIRKDNDSVWIKTEGINIIEMFKHDKVLDLNRLYCNDIHKIAETYGIEAAGRVLVKELKTVFGVYGITIDPRHLLLIADYMTFQGVFLPMNRTGMSDSASALQQISFESSTNFLKNALFQGKIDFLKSPSARICAGRLCSSGTGSFSVFSPLF